MSAAIGIDLGGTKLLGVVLDGEGKVVAEHRVPTPRGGPAILDALAGVARFLQAEVGEALPVGVGAPGLIDRDGRIRFAPNLPGVRNLEVRAGLSAALGGRPVVVDNDATCAGSGEHAHGAARGATDAIVVTLGTGIGGGLVVSGEVVRGANGFAGEIGHMVVDPHGPLCGCGRSGCWERYASGTGLARLGREAAHAGRGARMIELAGGDAEAVRGEHVTTAAAEGDAEAVEVLDRFAWWLAVGLANLANAFDPEVIVVGGGLVVTADLLLGAARRHFSAMVEAPDLRPPVRLEAALLGERAGAIGAAALARMLR
ncbi:MAG TPA: ROK family protein [Acidimicrobiales bacterium]|nr:ROK family protein [Acidimicrobiales bacterium]